MQFLNGKYGTRADEARAQKDMKTARELYLRALDLDHQNEKIFYGLAWTRILYKPDESIRDFTKAIELNPHYAEAYQGLAEAKGLVADCQGAYQDYQTYLSMLKGNTCKPAKNPLTLGCAILASDFHQNCQKKKALLQVGGVNCLQRMLGVVSMFTRQIVVVTDTPSDFSDFPGIRIIPDRYPEKHLIGGIFTAMRNLDTDAVLILRGDMPFLHHAVIGRIWYGFQENPKEACMPTIVVSKPFVEIRVGLRSLNSWPDPIDKPLHSIYHRSVLPKVLDFLAQATFSPPEQFFRSLDCNRIRFEKSEAVTRAFREIPENYDQNAPFPVIKR